MKRLIVNLLLFFVSIFLLSTIGLFGIVYTLIMSLYKFRYVSFVTYWGDILYSVNVGIDKIGNITLAAFLNKFAIIDKDYKFGNINNTISNVLAVNYFKNNLKPLGSFIVKVLEKLDPGHMIDSL